VTWLRRRVGSAAPAAADLEGCPSRSGAASWLNPPKRCSSSANIKTTSGTDRPNPMILTRDQRNAHQVLDTDRWMSRAPCPIPTARRRIGRCRSRRRRLTQSGCGRGLWCMCIWPPKRSPPAPASPGSKSDPSQSALHAARDHCKISLKPVIDLPAGHTPVDAYEIPAALRQQILLHHPADVFP
jgi:hypothetical protein